MPETVMTVPQMADALTRQMQREPDRVKALFYMTHVAHFNLVRLAYPTLTFHDKQRLYEQYLTLFPEEERFDTDFVVHHLSAVTPKAGRLTVAELGGYQGELARRVHDHVDVQWTSYELIHHTIPTSHNGFFTEHVLGCELWESTVTLADVDAFVAMHTIEHVSDDELSNLFLFLKRWRVPTLIFQSPVQPDGQTWRNYYGAHVLRMGSTQIKTFLAPEYRLVGEVPKGQHVWDGWCGCFEHAAC